MGQPFEDAPEWTISKIVALAMLTALPITGLPTDFNSSVPRGSFEQVLGELPSYVSLVAEVANSLEVNIAIRNHLILWPSK
jgi:hypothetical protein